jgi:glycosyltransferase involved in cell wall biosynthesis
VSVILTTFNRSALVRRAIDSVLGQTLEDFELIVVDDCSTDSTGEVVSAIDDPRISLIRNERNLGLAEARNAGIRIARGAFVCFLDDDDELLPDKLSEQVAAFDKEDNKDDVLLWTQAIVDDGVSTTIKPARGLRDREPLSEYLMRGEGALPIHALMVTRRLLSNTMFAAGERRFEDYTWLLRLEARGVRFVLVERALIIWHVELGRKRLSRVVTFDQALEWLDAMGDAVTPRARRAFLAREVAPFVPKRGSRRRIARTIGSAVVSRSISLPEAGKTVLKTSLRSSTLYQLRRVLRRSSFG